MLILLEKKIVKISVDILTKCFDITALLRYISVISVDNYINACSRYVSMRLLKHVDYKLKVHLIINTSSMFEFQLRKHNKSCIGTT